MALDKNKLKLFINELEIAERVEELAEKINEDFAGEKVILISVLSGSLLFTSDLIRKLTIDHEVRYTKIKSYQGIHSTKQMKLQADLIGDVSGSHVLIIEDIVDTGNTLNYLLDQLRHKNPALIKIVALLWKPEVYDYPHKIDYVGFNIPDHFVVGYGMDLDEEGRNLKDIYTYKN